MICEFAKSQWLIAKKCDLWHIKYQLRRKIFFSYYVDYMMIFYFELRKSLNFCIATARCEILFLTSEGNSAKVLS